jgi:hypothetical protein
MATIQIEADTSTEQVLHVVEQLPPREFAILLAQLLERARRVAPADAASPPIGTQAARNPYRAGAGMFADDSFADEVDAYIAAEREREREEATRAAHA